MTAAGGQARLTAITLQRGDLPASWKAAPYASNPADAANQAMLVACVGAKNTAPDKTGDAHSPTFSQGPAVISSSATSFRFQADVNADVAILHNPKINSCYQTLARRQLTSSLPAGTTITGLTLAITPGAGQLPSNVVATGAGQVGITASGKSATIYLNVAFITGPRIGAEIDFTSVGQPIASAMRTSLITNVAGRAARA